MSNRIDSTYQQIISTYNLNLPESFKSKMIKKIITSLVIDASVDSDLLKECYIVCGKEDQSS